MFSGSVHKNLKMGMIWVIMVICEWVGQGYYETASGYMKAPVGN